MAVKVVAAGYEVRPPTPGEVECGYEDDEEEDGRVEDIRHGDGILGLPWLDLDLVGMGASSKSELWWKKSVAFGRVDRVTTRKLKGPTGIGAVSRSKEQRKVWSSRRC